MSDEEAAPAKKKTPLKERIKKRALKVAEAEGADWKSLPPERRQEIKQAIRAEIKGKRQARKQDQAS